LSSLPSFGGSSPPQRSEPARHGDPHLGTSPPQRSREVDVSGAGLCVDVINRLRFWVYVGASCALVLVLMMVFCFQSFLSLKDIFKRRRFYVDEIFCVVIWSRDLPLGLKR
jgi:hypothetical protein